MKTLQIIKAYSISQIFFFLLLFNFMFVFFRDSQICDLNKIPKVALYSTP